MAALSNYSKGQLIAHYFRNGTIPKLRQLFFALFTTETTDATPGIEVSGGGYQRVAVAVDEGQFTDQVNGDGRSRNRNPILFGYPTSSWGRVTHWAVFDAGTGGNMLLHGPLQIAQKLDANDPPLMFMPNDFVTVFD